MQEPQVQSLGQEGPMEKGMAIHSNTLAWRIPWTEELGGLHSMGSQRVGHNRVTNTYTHTHTHTHAQREPINNIVLCEQQKESAKQIHISILPPNPLPPRLKRAFCSEI